MLRPNRKLRKLVEIIKSIEEGEGAERRVCQVLFCMDDQALICVACHPTSKHKGHNLVPMEKAAQEYKEKIAAQQTSLKKNREKIMEKKVAEEQRKQMCLREIEMQKRMIKSEFQKTESFLHAKERHQLAQLEDLKIEAEVKQNENITRFSEEISCLTELISEMEKKCQQPASEFLQDIRGTLHRCQSGQMRQVVEIPSGIEETLRSYSQQLPILKRAMQEIEVSLEKALEKGSLKESEAVKVILDPDTAHPFLRRPDKREVGREIPGPARETWEIQQGSLRAGS
ncbi:zinc finger protein RFP-like isoform X2 [Varanus komodoensis]|uniref:zinc finger protein RFP-like isoform X2 n=1 Tax=Varanus komodoensis TaxID=61221 RepID=UPI001CF791CE|nr:zinc finger protein RFP-like isoform X2 [Varanus komodoensis]